MDCTNEDAGLGLSPVMMLTLLVVGLAVMLGQSGM